MPIENFEWNSQMTCHSNGSTESIEHRSQLEPESPLVDYDQNRIYRATKELKNTGWYWGNLSASEAKEILKDTPKGTFLVRDSSQRNYLFTISAMTSAGPTNLRIEYQDGKFKLDSTALVKPKLRRFESVVQLVQHYALASRILCGDLALPSGTVQLLLTTPIYTSIPSLQHLCRVSINKTTREIQQLPLPDRLKEYVMDYSYFI